MWSILFLSSSFMQSICAVIYAGCDSSGCSVQGWELDCLILVDPLQIRTFCDSLIFLGIWIQFLKQLYNNSFTYKFLDKNWINFLKCSFKMIKSGVEAPVFGSGSKFRVLPEWIPSQHVEHWGWIWSIQYGLWLWILYSETQNSWKYMHQVLMYWVSNII